MNEKTAYYADSWLKSDNELEQTKNLFHLCRQDWIPPQEKEELRPYDKTGKPSSQD